MRDNMDQDFILLEERNLKSLVLNMEGVVLQLGGWAWG
jgi:hypothetical protein